jgi:hypothetical protein
MSNQQADINVQEDALAGTAGTIKMEQGFCLDPTTPAGNQFTPQFGSLVQIATDTNTTPFNYNHHIGIDYTPQTFGGSITPLLCQQSFLESCPANFKLQGNGQWEVIDLPIDHQKVLGDLNNGNGNKTSQQQKQIKSEIASIEAQYFNALASKENGIQLIINYLLAKPNKSGNDYIKLSEAHIINSNYVEAQHILATINEEKLASQIAYLQSYLTYKQANKTWFDLNSIEQQGLRNSLGNNANLTSSYNYNIHRLINNKSIKYRIPEARNSRNNMRKSIVKIADNSYISIYPNPSMGSFTIQAYNPINNFTKVIISDISGKKVFEQDVQVGLKSIAVNHNLKTGIYFVRVASSTLKLIVN